MLEKLKMKPTYKSVMEFAAEARKMVKKYKWENETVMPYSIPEKVTDVIDEIARYDPDASGSEFTILLANGLARILNSWEAFELEETVKVRWLITTKKSKIGDETEIKKTLAETYVECGFAEYC